MNGKLVRIGDFQSVVFNHELQRQIEIHLALTYDKEGEASYSTSWRGIGENHQLELAHTKAKSFVCDFTVEQNEERHHFINFFINKDEKNSDYLGLKNMEDFLGVPLSGSLEGQEVQDFKRRLDLDRMLFDSEINSSFNYISPFRFVPDRTYYQSNTNSKLDPFGSGYIDQILKWQDADSKKFEELIAIVKNISLFHDLRSNKLPGGRFEIQVKTKNNSSWESIVDVGFGISQFLPVVVADLQLVDYSTLIVSQPEIHLHPSIQANLSNYFVNQINTKNRQYILETHSEYLLNRIRLLIVQGELKKEDVAIYYFENSANQGSITHEIDFTQDGQILNAPQGFFETYMIDTMDIALNA